MIMDMSSDTEHAGTERRAARVALGVAISIFGLKFAAYLITNSAAVFSDAMESIVNVVASAFALYAIRLAHEPADRKHPYGHGKVEFFSAGLEGAMILVASIVIMVNSIEILVTHTHVEWYSHGMALLGVTMLINGLTGWYLIRAGNRQGSFALEADGKHLLTDAVTTAGVLLALLLVKLTGISQLDPITAMLVALWMLRTGVVLVRRSVAGLMDEQDLADDTLIRSILDKHIGTEICGYHKLRHRHVGRDHWVDFHVQLPSQTTVQRGHEVASAIEYEIETALGSGNTTAHIEPCDDSRCAKCTIVAEQSR